MRYIFLMLFLLGNLTIVFCQDSTFTKLDVKKIHVDDDQTNKHQERNKSDHTNETKVLPPKTIKIVDPHFQKEVGFSIITSSKIPYLGAKLDFNPVPSLVRSYFDLSLRTDLNKNNFVELNYRYRGVQIKNQYGYQFLLNYQFVNVEDYQLNSYQKWTIGVLKINSPKVSYGFKFGQDQYEKIVGVDLLANYELPINAYTQQLKFQLELGYWSKQINYSSGIHYFFNRNSSIGLENRKIYNLNEVLFSYRYILKRYNVRH